ncbi:unnamed protein product, partial [Discosporangium mesarthrocarpum]
VHGGAGDDNPGPCTRVSVRQSLPYVLQPTRSSDRPLHRPLHAHRLDMPTGGLLVCAKTRPALTALCDAFANREVIKTYRAIITGDMEGT